MSVNYYLLFVSVIGVLIYLFVIWKRFKEDYTPTILFNSAFIILIGLAVSAILAYFSFRQYWFWYILMGIIAGILLCLYKYKLNLFETIECVFIGLMPYLTLIYLTYAIYLKSWQLLVAVAVNLILMGFFFYLDSRYKRFVWYKSGKAGFAGVMTLGVYFLARGAIAMAFPFMISFVGKYDAILSGSFALVCFLLIYILSRGD